MGAGSGRRHHRLVGTQLRLRAAGGGLADARAAGEGWEDSLLLLPPLLGNDLFTKQLRVHSYMCMLLYPHSITGSFLHHSTVSICPL